jgi:hypothetical protein
VGGPTEHGWPLRDNAGVRSRPEEDLRKTPPFQPDISLGRLYLTEYERLKEEQLRRLGYRDNLIYATITSLGVILLFVFGTSRHDEGLLLVPGASLVLGWTYLVNDEKVSAIGRYIRLTLAPRLAQLAGQDRPGAGDRPEVFGWEVAHRSDHRRLSRKYLQLAIDLGTFCLPGVVAVVTYLLRDGATLVTSVVSGVDLVAMAILGFEMIVYADLKRGR